MNDREHAAMMLTLASEDLTILEEMRNAMRVRQERVERSERVWMLRHRLSC